MGVSGKRKGVLVAATLMLTFGYGALLWFFTELDYTLCAIMPTIGIFVSSLIWVVIPTYFPPNRRSKRSEPTETLLIKGRSVHINAKSLSIYDASLTNGDIKNIALLQNLTELSLPQNDISDLSPLSGLTKLTRLWLDDNKIVDLSPLAALTNLKVLSLDGNRIRDLRPLSKLTELIVLSLDRNYITDPSPLAKLTSLTRLSLYSNEISDAQSLAALTSLRYLFLDDEYFGVDGFSISDMF